MTPIKILYAAILTVLFASLSNFQADAALSTAVSGCPTAPQFAGANHHRIGHSHNTWFKHKHPANPSEEEPKKEPFGAIAMVLAATSLLGVFFFVPVFTAPVAIAFSIVSLVRIKRHPDKWKGKKRAIWALVLGIVALAATIGFYIYLVNYIFD